MSKRASLSELAARLQEAEALVSVGSSWRHYRDNKGEVTYTISGHAITEADETVVVLYNNGTVTFSRPLAEFIETVRGGTQKRFQKITT